MDIISDWALLEADFRREYNIDLVRARLSWRAFLILANGLSKDSLWTLIYKGRKEGTAAITDDELGEQSVEMIFK
jgi:Bacteriophage Gp15 protein